jgi:hypothetical protein
VKLVEKLVAVSKEIGFLEFDKKNSGQGYKYVSAASVIRKLNLELNKVGVLAYVSNETVDVLPFENTKGTKGIHAVVTATLAFTDGQDTIFASGSGSGWDAGDKAVMKASTAAYKYAIAHALTLGWDAVDPEDDGGGSAGTDEGGSKPAKKSRKAKDEAKGDLLARVEAAPTMAELEKLKPEVLAIPAGSDQFQATRDAYRARKAALGG